MVRVFLGSCAWETVIKQNNKGNTFLHLAVSRGNETFVRVALKTLFEVWPDDHITSL